MNIKNFSDWINLCGSIFRYNVSDTESYEMLINCYYTDTPIETANATLYKINYIKKENNIYLINRTLIGESLPVFELINMIN